MKIKDTFSKIPKFFLEVRKEVKQVSWPSRKQTLINTIIVISVSIAIAIYLGGLDSILTFIMGRIIE